MNARRRPRKVVATRTMERRRRRRRAVVALGITTALLAGTAYGTWRYIEENEYLLQERCEVTVGEDAMELSPHRTRNAAMITAAAVDRGLPPEAAVHGVAISMQEEDLLARQAESEDGPRALFARGTPSWADGPAAQVAETSIAGFFDVLESSWRAGAEAEEDADDGDEAEEDAAPEFWTPELPLDEAAAVLERPHNAQFYPQHAARARAFAWPLAGQQPVDMTCHLSQRDVPEADPEGLVDEVVTVLPRALQIPFTEPAEDADEEEAEEFEPEPILDGVVDVTGEGENALVRIQVPESEGDYDYQWMLAHWSVAVARDFGIQTVEAGPYTWQRDTARWDRTAEGASSSTEVTLGFSRDS